MSFVIILLLSILIAAIIGSVILLIFINKKKTVHNMHIIVDGEIVNVAPERNTVFIVYKVHDQYYIMNEPLDAQECAPHVGQKVVIRCNSQYPMYATVVK